MVSKELRGSGVNVGHEKLTYSIALHPHATNEFSQHVEGHLNTSHSFDDTNGDDEDQGQSDTERHHPGGRVSRPGGDTSESKGSCDDQDGEVPELGNW